MKSTARVPQYRRHARGQAIVKHQGRTIYLGKYGTDESRIRYRRFLEQLEVRKKYEQLQVGPLEARTVAVLIDLYLEFAAAHYVTPAVGVDGKPILGADGQPAYNPTPEFEAMRRVLEHVDVVMGDELAVKVGPALFERLQNHMIGLGYCRKNINRLISRAKRLFKWSCAKEYCPPEIYARLACVETLRKGRTTAKEMGDVQPVPREVVDATLPWLSPVVADMVRVQRICGMRPSEVCGMWPCEIDRRSDIWLYEPTKHKNEWRGQIRVVAIPKSAQAILGKYMDRDPDRYLFSPRESEKQRNDQRFGKATPARKTRIFKSELKRRAQKKKARAATAFTDKRHCYDRNSYRRAISYGVEKANRNQVNVPKWHPYQLRHSAATEISETFGFTAASVWLGHADIDSTNVYVH